eukprot:m.311221 g.311221  ORF g.311221 m.311221 type:complete len:356 (+) comp62458_c0_seq1:123-1190(+)
MAATSVDRIHGQEFRIPGKYSDLRFIGAGSHSVVCSAFDETTDSRVAVKKLTLAPKGYSRAVMREIQILTHLNHENIVSVHEIVKAGSEEDYSDAVYLIQELMSTDLRKLLQNRSLEEDHIRIFLYGLLRGAKYMHSANVIHRDIKPSNLLIDGDLNLKICDFGLARIVDAAYNHSGFLTEMVCTQWYRAPEVMLTPKQYGNKIDIWSIGCVFAEMIAGGRPIFPGGNELQQIQLILNTVALTESDLQGMRRISERMCPQHVRVSPSWGEALQAASADALDLLGKMLTFSAEKRVTAEEALAHPYFQEFSSCGTEPVASQPFYIENEVDDQLPENLIREKILLSCSSVESKESRR